MRAFSNYLLRTIAILFLLGCGLVPALAAQRPNIVFIMADDLGYGDLGCYGQREIQTPHLDAMAAEGIRFTNVYAGSPVCAPSRCVLMTGMHTGHATVRGNTGKFGVKGLGGARGRVPLNEEDVTVAEVLESAGYSTAMIGKWGLGEPGTTGEPNRKGWGYFFGYLNQRRAHSYYPDYLWRNREKVRLPGNAGGRQKQHSHFLLVDDAIKFIQNHDHTSEQPFFLYLPVTFPHTKFQIPSVAPYEDRPWEPNAKVQAAMVTQLDSDVGRILTELKELGIDENTVVFFCSDNGAHMRWDGLFDSSGSLRGRKREVYEGGIRTPMIVRWPGKIKPGTVDETPWAFWDVMPTLADMGGASQFVPKSIDGVSVLKTLRGQTQPELLSRVLYWEFFEKGFVQAARKGKWKAVRFAGKPTELYDLSEDAEETRDVSAEHQERVNQFEAEFESMRTKSRNWPVVERAK